MNLDLLYQALNGETVEVWHSPDTKTTYIPAKIGAIAKDDEIKLALDKRGFIRYNRVMSNIYATKTEALKYKVSLLNEFLSQVEAISCPPSPSEVMWNASS